MDYQPSRVLSYVVASDRGLAPNLTGGICSLAVCKPMVRRAATSGRDIILGLSTAAHGRNRVIYAMLVDEKISYDEFFRDPRFAGKKPDADPMGDNFFRLEGDAYTLMFNNAAHAGKEDRIGRDLREPVAVLSKTFWYFGGNAPELPKSLHGTTMSIPDRSRRGHRVVDEAANVRDLVKWIGAHAPGIHGTPRDLAL